MAKKTKQKAAFFAGLQDSARKEYGDDGAYSIREHQNLFTGVPLPSLSFEYLFGSDVLVLGMVYGIAGAPQSFKSALALSLCLETVIKHGGGGALCETEGRKISAPMVGSIFKGYEDSLIMRNVDSVEKAQDYLTWLIDKVQKETNRDQMMGLILDSLSGPATEESIKKIRKEGHASRDYSSEALYWTAWFKSMTNSLAGWPIALFFVNHEKQKVDGGNAHVKSRPGGIDQEFRSAVYTSVRRGKENKSATKTITELNLRTCKNSLGEFNRRIVLPFVYDREENSMGFDYVHSDAHLLVEHRERIKDVVNVTTTADSVTSVTRLFSCKELGLVKVKPDELMKALRSQDDLMEAIRRKLGINPYKKWKGIMPSVGSSPVEANELSAGVPAAEDSDIELDA
jgi:hypothetical protein